jgi:hypothetical protein
MRHIITDTGNGWLLKIWEPAPPVGDRTLPFLYKIKSIHSSQADAENALAYHQKMNRCEAMV